MSVINRFDAFALKILRDYFSFSDFKAEWKGSQPVSISFVFYFCTWYAFIGCPVMVLDNVGSMQVIIVV